MTHPVRRMILAAAAAVMAGAVSIGLGTAAPAFAASYAPITGEGSSWASVAIQDWAASVKPSGLQVNWTPNASYTALQDFGGQNANSYNFVASDVPYGLPNQQTPSAPGRGFAYVPDVAGGTALMYNLKVGGQKFQNLKLDGATIAGIYMGQIKMWNDAKIQASNPGVALPPLAITPVFRGDQSGSTYQFSLYMRTLYSNVWTCGAITDPNKCPSWDPTKNTQMKPQTGDAGVAGYVSQTEGAIGYVQYAYALQAGFPAAKVLNKSGFYVLPTASNVAVALLDARVNMDKGNRNVYLTQDLTGVYSSGDMRSYPISSYSYFVVPTSLQNGVDNEKGNSIGTFVNYALCQGQSHAATLGYSPLPKNLVQAGLDQVLKIPGHPAGVSISSCSGNPTFSPSGANLLAQNALYPDVCDKTGAKTGCAYGTAARGGKSSSTNGQSDNNAVGNHSSGGSDGGGTTATTGGGTSGAPGSTTPGGGGTAGGGGGGGTGGVSLLNPDGKTVCDPDTGQCTQIAASPVLVANSIGSTFSRWAMWIAVSALILAIAVPPVLVLVNKRRARS